MRLEWITEIKTLHIVLSNFSTSNLERNPSVFWMMNNQPKTTLINKTVKLKWYLMFLVNTFQCGNNVSATLVTRVHGTN